MTSNCDIWKEELKHRILADGILKRFPALKKRITQKQIAEINKEYHIGLTSHYASLIDAEDPEDPLLKTVFPNAEELNAVGMPDQSGEKLNASKTGVPGLQHKYEATALFTVTGACGAYCRFCFRRRFVGTEEETVTNLDKAFKYIEAHHEITNVLLSGGDSLILENKRIEKILEGLRKIEHVGVIRFGSRLPVYLPSRFKDDKLLELIRKYSLLEKRIYVVSHIEHPRELCRESIEAHRKLMDKGATIMSQTVMLNGINNNSDTLAQLFKKIANVGIRPYYIFQCRPVIGGAHLRVSLLDGYVAVDEAKRSLGGLSKTTRYAMSHVSGKIEIVFVEKKNEKRVAIFKHHSARDPKYIGKFMEVEYEKPAYWFDDIFSQPHKILRGKAVAEYAKGQIARLQP